MKQTTSLLAALLSTGVIANAQVLISDDYNVTGNGTGFTLDQGVNSGINPPTTRMGGTLANGMQYFSVGTARNASFYTIAGNKLQVNADGTIGRFTLSNDGVAPYDFGSALGTSLASAATPLTYDIKISMANHQTPTTGTLNPRFSFGIGTAEGDAGTWDFGVQVYQSTGTSGRNRIQKRIDSASSGLAGDSNDTVTTQGAGSFGNEVDFLIRITDAGAESGGNYNSRVQVSLNGGTSFIYDTAADATLVNGFRFDGSGRFLDFDIAPSATGSGYVTYDNFSLELVTPVPEPATSALLVFGGIGAFWFYRRRNS